MGIDMPTTKVIYHYSLRSLQICSIPSIPNNKVQEKSPGYLVVVCVALVQFQPSLREWWKEMRANHGSSQSALAPPPEDDGRAIPQSKARWEQYVKFRQAESNQILTIYKLSFELRTRSKWSTRKETISQISNVVDSWWTFDVFINLVCNFVSLDVLRPIKALHVEVLPENPDKT